MIDKPLDILAGGKSTRMNNNNKALLLYKEKKFIDHIIAAGKDYKEIIIVANDKSPYKSLNLRVVEDIHCGNGPLSGIHSALVNSSTDKVLCVACDMPFINRETLKVLGAYDEAYEVLVPVVSDRMQPLCAVYSKKIINKLEEELLNNNNKLQLVIKKLDYKIINGNDENLFLEENFQNINTVKEYEDLEGK